MAYLNTANHADSLTPSSSDRSLAAHYNPLAIAAVQAALVSRRQTRREHAPAQNRTHHLRGILAGIAES